MLAFALAAAAETAEETHELPMPPLAFALIALSVFAVLFVATFAFLSAGTKHGPQH
jgi:hypothetical protein